MSEPQIHVPAKGKGPCSIRRVFERLQRRRVPFTVESEFASNRESQMQLLTVRMMRVRRRTVLNADRDRHVWPGPIGLTLESPQIDRGDRQT